MPTNAIEYKQCRRINIKTTSHNEPPLTNPSTALWHPTQHPDFQATQKPVHRVALLTGVNYSQRRCRCALAGSELCWVWQG